MKILVLDDYMDHAKYAPSMQNLCAQIEKNCLAETESMIHEDFDLLFVRSKTHTFDAIIMSGSEALYSKPEDKAKFSKAIEATKEVQLPLLGICGGHQLIGMAYGEQVVNMGKSIKGYRDVEIIADDPLFDDLPRVISVTESHQEMVEHVPTGFELLANSEDTPIEAFRIPHRVLYGVQFHPERNDNEHPAGATVLRNFGRLVKR